MSRSRIARTRNASGRLLLPLLAVLAACLGPPPTAAPPAGASYPDPVLSREPISPGREVRAAELARQAQEALESGNPTEALRLASEVVDAYPEAPVSGVTLMTLARAALEVGALDTADAAAERLARLLLMGDPRVAEARLLQADAQARRGDQAARLERLLRIGPRVPTALTEQVAAGAREASAALGPAELERVLVGTPPGAPARAVALARYASVLEEEGRVEDARRWARVALDSGARGADSLAAVAVLEGPRAVERPAAEPGAPGIRQGRRGPGITLATVLPIGGPPGLGDVAREIAEGVEVAGATGLPSRDVTFEARDDQGDAALAGELTADLEARGVLGAVGFLEEAELEAAASRRSGAMPLVSPTARVAVGEGVYTLSGAEPMAAAAMARWAGSRGFKRVAVIHSRSGASTEEADAFAAALAAEGIPLAAREAYDPSATYFREQIEAVQEALRGQELRSLRLGPTDTLDLATLDPVALFVPIPPEDVELVAPQLTFYGLDTLGVQILGTSGWTDRQTLEAVDNRHTNGVVATAPAGAGPGSDGYERFRRMYEEHFRRTLASPLPALGYDAALLLLDAARNGARTAQELRSALDHLQGLQGATGVFSVVGGRVVRRTEIVLIEHGNLIPTS